MDNIKENTTYIFTFGNTGVGKSTLMASVTNFIGNHPDVQLRMNVVYNQEGTSILLRDWLTKLSENKFPPITPREYIFQIDVGIQENNSTKIIPLTLLEMSGENLRQIDLRRQEESFELKNNFQELLKRSSVILLVTSYDRAREDDLLFHQFFEWMEHYQVNAPIGLVISKWDLAQNKDILVTDYVRAVMKFTSKFLIKNRVGDVEIFDFSVGEVDGVEIKALNLNASGKIAEWIFDCINN